MLRTIALQGVAVTPSDTNYITGIDGEKVIGSLYIGTGGDICVLLGEHAQTNSPLTTGVGGAMLYKNVPDGFVFPYGVQKVFSTGTTASDIICHFG